MSNRWKFDCFRVTVARASFHVFGPEATTAVFRWQGVLERLVLGFRKKKNTHGTRDCQYGEHGIRYGRVVDKLEQKKAAHSVLTNNAYSVNIQLYARIETET